MEQNCPNFFHFVHHNQVNVNHYGKEVHTCLINFKMSNIKFVHICQNFAILNKAKNTCVFLYPCTFPVLITLLGMSETLII